ncbi:MAG: 4-(cytidine 5'-diphospho)-2-C-methyl-D-erythritol kinase [Clostridia bacterium]|nr:4-(cytidine 5'-diphospho)-2-C-methyl-D-erythritol kinase [Clostridia bacterium]
MRKIKLKIPAKINLTLDVVGTEGKFHEIKSLVTSVNVYDTITIEKRADNQINLTMKGLNVDCSVPDNNAYKAAKLFAETFSTGGVNVTVNKKIPVGGGMGGSSADIAGVLKGMNELYEVDLDMGELADKLGSDVRYMLGGGYAVLSGRGQNVEEQFISKTLYFILIKEEKIISARSCYKKYDALGKILRPCTKTAVKALLGGNFEKYSEVAKNDLYPAACTFVRDIEANVKNLKRAGANVALMTGSGSVVFGVFETAKERDKIFKKLKPLYGKGLIKAKTVF